jgi:tetratricopeptide (TPR) repeat protein
MPIITVKQAHDIHLAGDLKTAEAMYHELLNDHPDEWSILFFLGGLYLQQNKQGIAIQLFNRALEQKPNLMEAWNNLGVAYRQRFMNDKAGPCFMRALAINENADSYNNMGTIHVNEGSPADGERWLRKAVELQPDFMQAHWNLALTLLEQGRYEEGFKEYAWGLKSKDRLVKHYDCKWWRGQTDGKVVVYGEQGIGDEIMFFSMIPDLIRLVGKENVVLDCHPRLANLFEHSFGVKVYPTRKEVQEWHWENPVDYKVAAGNLGSFFRRGVEDFPGTPYLSCDPDGIREAHELLATLPARRPNIGISWRGGKHKTKTASRSMSLQTILKAFEGVDANLISLQYDEGAAEDCKGTPVHHWPDHVAAKEYERTAALVSALDLVVTVNTSAVHLCGALGKECITLTPKRKAWRYYSPDGSTMPWYRSVTIYEQKTDGDWADVLGDVNKELRARQAARA